MAIGLRVAGTWATLTADGAVSIPATPQAGDRMYLLAAWKPFDTTAQVTSPAGWTELTEFADGSVANGNGTGSVKVACWYRDWQSGDGNPTIDFSVSPDVAGAVIVVFSKGATEAWTTPLFVTAAMTNWTTTSQIVSASSTVAVPNGGVVISLIGIRDDSATMTRPTTGIDVASGITWNGNYVESPAAHLTTTTGFDLAVDAGYRLVTTGGTVTLRQTGTISAAETGAALWIVQGVVTATDAPAGNAAGTGAANDGDGGVGPPGTQAAGTGSAANAKNTVSPTSAVAASTGAANDGDGGVGAVAQAAVGAGTASNPSGSVFAKAGVAAGTGSASGSTGSNVRAVLVVGNKSAPTTFDTYLKTSLEGFSHTVLFVDDDDPEDTVNDVVFIAASVDAAKIGNKYRDTPVPLMVFNQDCWNQMDFVSADSSPGVREEEFLDITNPAHQLAGGFSGTITPVDSPRPLGYSNQTFGPGVIHVASLAGTSDRFFFAYDAGATMVNDHVTDARRIGMGVTDSAGVGWTMDGPSLLDNAIDWLVQPVFITLARPAAAAGTGAASNAVAADAPTGVQSAGSGSAFNASVKVESGISPASGTGAASNAGPSTAPTSQSASVAGSASGPKGSVAPGAGPSSGTGSAAEPTISSSGETNAGAATGTGAAAGASLALAASATASQGSGAAAGAAGSLSAGPTTSAGSGSASGPSAGLFVSAGTPSGVGAASGPTASIKTSPSTGAGVGQAFDGAPTSATVTNVDAQAATGAGVSNGPAAAISFSALVASGTGATGGVSAALGSSAGAAGGSGAAGRLQGAVMTTGFVAGGVGAANEPGPAVVANGQAATGAGVAFNAAVTSLVLTDAVAQVASGLGIASSPSISIQVGVGLAAGTGLAFAPFIGVPAVFDDAVLILTLAPKAIGILRLEPKAKAGVNVAPKAVASFTQAKATAEVTV